MYYKLSYNTEGISGVWLKFGNAFLACYKFMRRFRATDTMTPTQTTKKGPKAATAATESTPAESVWASLAYAAYYVSKIAVSATALFLLVAGILWLTLQLATLFLPKGSAPGFSILSSAVLIGGALLFLKRRNDARHLTKKPQSKIQQCRKRGSNQ